MSAIAPALLGNERRAAVRPTETGLSAVGRLAFISLWLFVFTLPGEKVLEIPGIGTISRLVGLAAIGMGILALSESRRIRRPAPGHLAMMAFVFWSAASYCWSLAPDWTQEKVFTYLQLLAMAWLIWEFGREDREQQSLMRAYVLGTLVSAGDTIGNFFLNRQTYYLRYATTGFDPNDLGLTLALSLPLSYYLALRGKGVATWVYRLQMIAAAGTILLTASRGALLACGIGLMLVPWTFGGLSAHVKIANAAAAVFLIAAAMLFVPQSSWTRLATIQSEVTQGTLNKRTMIWGAGLEAFREHSFGGVGAGAYPAAVEPVLGRENGMVFVAHNTFLSVLVEGGAIGFLTFCGLLGVLALSIRDLDPLERKLWTVTLAAWAVGVTSLTWEQRKPTWFLFSLLTAQWGSVRAWRAPANEGGL